MKTYTIDNNQIAIALVQAGTAVADVANVTRVHERTIRKWLATAAETAAKCCTSGPTSILSRSDTKHAAGMVRESKSPHSTSTFCVRKPNGKWRIVHAFNKLNAATIPAQTPIPRKDVLQNNMVGCTMYSALDLVDGYYQLASDIPLTAVSTPSGMLWEWLVMHQGLSNAPATFNRLVTQLFRPLWAYAQTYFDDIFVHSRAADGRSDVENHIDHLRAVLEYMRTNKLYANS
jgi:hypothetical protein